MALVNCPQCGKPVSDKAVKCPHCGEKLGRAKLIQEQNFKVNTRIVKAIISVLVAIFGILALLTLFVVVPGWVSFYYGHLVYFTPLFQMPKIPEAYIAIGFAIVSGVLTLGLFVYGVIRLKKDKPTTWNFWGISLIVALLSAYGTLFFTNRADVEFYSLQSEKVDAARGTYEWVSKSDGTTTSFSMCYGGFVEYHGKMGEVAYFSYDYEHDKLGVAIDVDGEETIGWYDADMKYVETKSGRVSVKKISDLTFSREEWLAKKQEEQNQAKLEADKNFRTMDLSAFMLHGKVKSVEESNGGQVACTYYFSEQGELTKAVMSEGNYRCKIKRKTNKLVLSFENPNDEYGGWGYVYTVDNSGRLISSQYGSEDFGDEATYSDFNSNGWPTRSKSIAELGGAVTISSLSYSQIDEHGNWGIQKSMDDEGNEIITYRSIEYYPIGQ